MPCFVIGLGEVQEDSTCHLFFTKSFCYLGFQADDVVKSAVTLPETRLCLREEMVFVQEPCEAFIDYSLHNFSHAGCEGYWAICLHPVRGFSRFRQGDDRSFLPIIWDVAG